MSNLTNTKTLLNKSLSRAPNNETKVNFLEKEAVIFPNLWFHSGARENPVSW